MTSQVAYTKSDANSKFYKPLDDGLINVVRDMPWTLSPISSRGDVPYIELTEFQQTTGQLIASLVYYARVLNNINKDGIGTVLKPDNPEDVYRYKYFAEPTGFKYILPYFNTKKLTRGNTFGSEESAFAGLQALGGQAVAGGRGGIAAFFAQAKAITEAGLTTTSTIIPGAVNFESPQSWTGTSIETIEVTFDLFNTDSVEDAYRNRRFCNLISYQNSPSRRNFAIVDPPVIYSLYIPDIIQFPACYVEALNITNLGNTRTMLDEKGIQRIFPEAYRINITFKSLLMPTRNLVDSLESGRKVEAICDLGTLTPIIEKKLSIIQNEDISSPEEAKKFNDGVLKDFSNYFNNSRQNCFNTNS